MVDRDTMDTSKTGMIYRLEARAEISRLFALEREHMAESATPEEIAAEVAKMEEMGDEEWFSAFLKEMEEIS
jgi:hypothetical protein